MKTKREKTRLLLFLIFSDRFFGSLLLKSYYSGFVYFECYDHHIFGLFFECSCLCSGFVLVKFILINNCQTGCIDVIKSNLSNDHDDNGPKKKKKKTLHELLDIGYFYSKKKKKRMYDIDREGKRDRFGGTCDPRSAKNIQ